ncbi:MAG: hypothetical protein KGJ62_15510 [Armatimonadetes bacterium]|nr:hypothetical protein [Armatimonadota bacterium]MDE2206991.1 hypothetical protein [Armatimonadota bacterium]
MVHVGARYYGPQVGRFASRDTMLDQIAYAYCGGEPNDWVDPSGDDWSWGRFWNYMKENVGVTLGGAGGIVVGTWIGGMVGGALAGPGGAVGGAAVGRWIGGIAGGGLGGRVGGAVQAGFEDPGVAPPGAPVEMCGGPALVGEPVPA